MLIWPRSSDSKDVKNINRDAYIKAASIGSTYTRDIYISKSTSTGNTFLARDAYIRSTFVGGTYIRSICIGSTGAVKYLIIHLQSF